MSKQQHKTILSGAAGAGAVPRVVPSCASVRAISPLAKSTAPAQEHERLARLAYFYWQDRGCPEGSPEEDWLRAEAEQVSQSAATVS